MAITFLKFMSIKYGFRTKNTSGSYIIDGEHFNSFLMKEVSLAKGFHTVGVNRPKMPSIAIRNGCGRIVSADIKNGIYVSVRLFIIPNVSEAQIRIYSIPVTKDDFGLVVYNQEGSMVFSSAEKLLDVNDNIANSIDSGLIPQSQNPPGYSRSDGPRTPKGHSTYNYTRNTPVSGQWLLLNSITAFGSTWTEVPQNLEGWESSYTHCAGLISSFLWLKTDNSLLVYDNFLVPQGYDIYAVHAMVVGDYIITIND